MNVSLGIMSGFCLNIETHLQETDPAIRMQLDCLLLIKAPALTDQSHDLRCTNAFEALHALSGLPSTDLPCISSSKTHVLCKLGAGRFAIS